MNTPTAWTVISRHGEYTQGETECNVPGGLSVGNSELTINTTNVASTCGDFNSVPGSSLGNIRTSPISWPWTTGDIQWNTFKFRYGTVIVRAKLPPASDNLWTAFWLLDAKCQASNKYTGDTSGSGVDPACPNLGTAGYTEIDMDEWNPPQFHVANPGFSIGGGCDWTSPAAMDANYHVYTTNWSANAITYSIDGSLKSTCNQSLGNDMFFITQIQTSNSCANANNCYPGSMVIDYVKVCNSSYTAAQCTAAATDGSDAQVIFYDDFNGVGTSPAAPKGLTAIVK